MYIRIAAGTAQSELQFKILMAFIERQACPFCFYLIAPTEFTMSNKGVLGKKFMFEFVIYFCHCERLKQNQHWFNWYSVFCTTNGTAD